MVAPERRTGNPLTTRNRSNPMRVSHQDNEISTEPKTWTRRIAAPLIAAATALAAAGLTAAPANADAHGVEPIPAFTIDAGKEGTGLSFPVPVPSGYLAHSVVGDGNKISKEFAAYSIATGAGGLRGQICNWRIDFEYKAKGKKYKTIKGKTNSSCDLIGSSVVVSPGKVKYGEACAVLYVEGKRRGAQCHHITK
ncbi:hypothetical protein [Saccharopolyspora shandongensis]|uniref:hypothetical protein n=1 Tax=Saccharopolyspora shandongensis TaxID=418495 RepID=UPI0033DAC1A8